jgi:hypothetical protein
MYERKVCRVSSNGSAPSILQAYLSDSEFQSVFGMTKDAFYKQPGWKQELQKRKADLF